MKYGVRLHFQFLNQRLAQHGKDVRQTFDFGRYGRGFHRFAQRKNASFPIRLWDGADRGNIRIIVSDIRSVGFSVYIYNVVKIYTGIQILVYIVRRHEELMGKRTRQFHYNTVFTGI